MNRVINPGIDYYLNSSTYSTFIDPTISGWNNEVSLREDTLNSIHIIIIAD